MFFKLNKVEVLLMADLKQEMLEFHNSIVKGESSTSIELMV